MPPSSIYFYIFCFCDRNLLRIYSAFTFLVKISCLIYSISARFLAAGNSILISHRSHRSFFSDWVKSFYYFLIEEEFLEGKIPISRISSGSSLTREMRLMSIKACSATLFNIFIFFVLTPPLPLASSAAALRFASGIAQVDGCTRVLSYNNQLSEMLRSAFLRIYFPRQNIFV